MTYAETLQYMYSQLPMFQRVGAAAYKANLDNTVAICNALNNPQHQFKSIHVGGTNGKGSTSHMLASILQSAGYKVGLYTSPHLKDFRERIKINGKMISKNYVVDFVAEHKLLFEKIKPSFFEMTVGLAFQYFAEKKVDVAVIEVGLGGRLDSTNVISPLLSVITNISFDHVNLLGNTLPAIANEKAGIIKNNTPVVIGEYQKEIADVFLKKSNKEQSDIYFASNLIKISSAKQINKKGKLNLQLTADSKKNSYKNTLCELPGMYQAKNAATVIQAAEVLQQNSFKRISKKNIQQGIANVVSSTGLLGRWQVLQYKPLVITDTGHNAAGITEITGQLKKIKYKKLHLIIGVVNDKDIDGILKLLPKKAIYYFCKPNIPRGLDALTLSAQAAIYNLTGNVYPSVKSALKAAKQAAHKNDLIFVGGSTFVAAEVV